MLSSLAHRFGGRWIGRLGQDRLVRGFGVLGLGEMFVRVSRIATAIVLARYLTAVELGIAATALACFELCRVLANNGIGQAVVRAPEERLQATCNSAYRLTWILCGLTAAVQIGIGAAIASYTSRPDLLPLIACTAGVYALMPWGMVQYWLLQRDYRMGAIAAVNTAQVGTDNLLTAALAIAGAGPWAVVLPKLLTAPLWLALVRRSMVWKPAPAAGYEPLRPLLTFSAPILASEMLVAVRFNVDKFLVGAILGVEALGIYYFAFNAGYGLSLVLTSALSAASYPHLADQRLSTSGMIGRFDRAIMQLALPISAVVLLQAMAVFVYVPILFGQQWASATMIVAVLCVSAATKAWHDLGAQLLRAAGLPGYELLAAVAFTGAFLGCFALALPFGLLTGVAMLTASTILMQVMFAAWARRQVISKAVVGPPMGGAFAAPNAGTPGAR